MAGVALAPAHGSELDAAAALAAHTTGSLMGDRNDWVPLLTDAFAADVVCLLAPCRNASQDPDAARRHDLSRMRDRIETVFDRLVERDQIKRVRARDLWPLQSRLMRKVLGYTVAILLNHTFGNPPRQFALLLA